NSHLPYLLKRPPPPSPARGSCPSRGTCLPRWSAAPGPSPRTVELAEAEVAVGGEWTHAKLVGPRERLPVVAFRRPHVGRVARGGDFAEEAQRPALETSLPARARARESLLRSFPPFLHLAR